MGTTVTVASAGGEDYTSVRAALIAISSGASAADKNTVLIMDSSTYTEDFDDSNIMNKSNLILIADTGQTPILYLNPGNFRIENGSNWEINGIEFKYSSSSSPYGLYFYPTTGSTGHVITDCTFTIVSSDTTRPAVKFNGSYDVVEVEFNNCIFRNSYGGYYSTYVFASGTIYPKIKFINCDFQKGYRHFSIAIQTQTSVSSTYYVTFDRCTFTAARTYGYLASANTHFHACLFYNFTYSGTRTAIHPGGANGCKGLEILKCTFYNLADGALKNNSNYTDSQTTVKDNIFYSCGTMDTLGNKYGSGFDYNCLYGTSYDAGYGGIGSNSITSDPKLTTPGSDFTLQSDSPCIGDGTDLSSYGVTADLSTDSLPQGGSWDMGAYEYVPTVFAGGINFISLVDYTTFDVNFLTKSAPDQTSAETTGSWSGTSVSGALSFSTITRQSEFVYRAVVSDKLYLNITYEVDSSGVSTASGSGLFMDDPGTGSFTGSCRNGGIDSLSPTSCTTFNTIFSSSYDKPDQTSAENPANWLFEKNGVSQSLDSISKVGDYEYSFSYGEEFSKNTTFKLTSLSVVTDTGGDIVTPSNDEFDGFCFLYPTTSSGNFVRSDYTILTHEKVKNDRVRDIDQLPFMYGLGNTSIFGFRNTTIAKKVTQ